MAPKELIKNQLVGWANMMFARYGQPVWLVGSVLTSEDPNDIDIRIVLPNKSFISLFDDSQWLGVPCYRWPQGSKNWAIECGKQARWVAKHCGLIIDFQIQSDINSFKYNNKPRYRIDEITDNTIIATCC